MYINLNQVLIRSNHRGIDDTTEMQFYLKSDEIPSIYILLSDFKYSFLFL